MTKYEHLAHNGIKRFLELYEIRHWKEEVKTRSELNTAMEQCMVIFIPMFKK